MFARGGILNRTRHKTRLPGFILGLVAALCLSKSIHVSAQNLAPPVSTQNDNGSISQSSGMFIISITGEVYNSLPYDVENVEVVGFFPENFSTISTMVKEVKAGKTTPFSMQLETAVELTRFLTAVEKYDIKSQDVSGLIKLFAQTEDVVLKRSIAMQFSRLDPSSISGLIECINPGSRADQNVNYADTDLICLSGLVTVANANAVEPVFNLANWYESRGNQMAIQSAINDAISDADNPINGLTIFDELNLSTLFDIEVEVLTTIGGAAVPQLLEVSLSESDQLKKDLALSALREMGKNQPSSVLNETNPDILIELIKAYSRHKTSEAVFPLLLINPEYASEEFINGEILSMGEDAVPGLSLALYGANGHIAERSENLLRGLGPDTVPSLQKEIITRTGVLPESPHSINQLVDTLAQLARASAMKKLEFAYQKAWTYFENGNCERAIAEIEKLPQIRDDIIVHPVEISKIYLCGANDQIQQGDNTRAHRYLEAAHGFNPVDDEIKDRLYQLDLIIAKDNAENGDLNVAIHLSRRAISLKPDVLEAAKLLWTSFGMKNFVFLAGGLVSLIILLIRVGDHTQPKIGS